MRDEEVETACTNNSFGEILLCRGVAGGRM